MSGTDFALNSNFQLTHEPVAILSVDTSTKMAKGLTRVRAMVTINCAYPVGGMYILPATGEQWYIERLNDYHWKLVSRIPFNDNNTLLEPIPGQMIIGGTGPVVLNGSQMDVYGDTTVNGSLTVGDTLLRGDSGSLEQSNDGGDTWNPIEGGSGSDTLVDGSVNGTPTALTLWTGTQTQYDAITTPDPTTVYIVTG
jgi:hypothetical protein